MTYEIHDLWKFLAQINTGMTVEWIDHMTATLSNVQQYTDLSTSPASPGMKFKLSL